MKKATLTISLLILFFASWAQQEKYSKVKLYLSSPDQFELLTQMGIALENLEHKSGEFIVGEFAASELQLIRKSGIPLEILVDDMASFYLSRNASLDISQLNEEMRSARCSVGGYVTPANFSLGSMGGYHTYPELLAELDKMRNLYPNLISAKQQIGLGTTIQNRPVYWVRISNNPDTDQAKRRVLYTALTHAREPASMQQMLYQMWYLLENYATNPEIAYIINNLELYFIPCVNPDGYIYNQTTNPNGGGMWRKNMRPNGDGSTGVDLNRNFGYNWGYDNSGSSPNGSALTYRGTAPFSEPETQLIKLFAETKNFDLALNNHTYSNILIYPWAYANLTTPDAQQFEAYAKLMTEENGYIYGTCYQTLSYTANGGSDDWFYGEQLTKKKVIALTPEAGSPADGFWPQANRIEAICARHTQMNIYLSRFALKYAKTVETAPKLLGSFQAHIPLETLCLGIDTPANFTVTLTPLTNNILSVDGPKLFDQMKILQSRKDTFHIQLRGGTAFGEEIRFLLSTSNGAFTYSDTITKQFGVLQEVLSDAASSMLNWTTSGGWGLTSTHFVSPSTSITDSPSGFYSANANTSITLNQPIDLTGALSASVEFMARWDIETNWDYAQFMVSANNGLSWTALPGKYTSVGGSNQDAGKPLYHGAQVAWVKENIDLKNFIGQSVRLRFRLISDGSIQKDGFYFDDFRIFTTQEASTYNLEMPGTISFLQGGTIQFDASEFITTTNLAEHTLTWQSSPNIQVELNGWSLSFSAVSPNWHGTETILFRLNGPRGYIDQRVDVICLKVNSIPAITGQSDLFTNQGEPIEISLSDITVSDEDNAYPDDFSLQILSGDNYTFENLTILPVHNFLGYLSVPVRVNDGIDDSEIFPLQIEVRQPLGTLLTQAPKPQAFYSALTRELIILNQSSMSINFIRLIDGLGRNVVAIPLGTNVCEYRVGLKSGLPQGIYFVVVDGTNRFVQKIVIP